MHADTNLESAFRSFVGGRHFPCVGAKSAMARGDMQIITARDIRSGWDDLPIYRALTTFARRFRKDPRPFQSFVVLFEQPAQLSERQFESALWSRVQSLSDKDSWSGKRWDPRVDSDPASPNFALSFEEEAFFVVGLHPGASRPARRFQTPALVFNPHQQFQTLRQERRYENLRESIIERDVSLAGSANPMLARHGEQSAAAQYSGRAVGKGWQCPFSVPTRASDRSSSTVSSWFAKPIAGW